MSTLDQLAGKPGGVPLRRLGSPSPNASLGPVSQEGRGPVWSSVTQCSLWDDDHRRDGMDKDDGSEPVIMEVLARHKARGRGPVALPFNRCPALTLETIPVAPFMRRDEVTFSARSSL